MLYAPVEAEGRRLRNPFDTVTEGIGLNRLTANFATALIDGAFRGTDQECVEMAAYLMRNDGLFLGSSAAMNCGEWLARKLLQRSGSRRATAIPPRASHLQWVLPSWQGISAPAT